MTRASSPLRTSSVLVGAFVWLLLAIGVGASGILTQLRPPGPQMLLLGVTAICLLLVAGLRPVRCWALSVDERVLVAFHLTRFVGIYFLVLHARGELPYGFAVVGGWGDITVAMLALGLLVTGGAAGGWRRAAYAAWNAVGLIDILFVIATAARSALADPASMRPLQQLPLNLLLTYVVPIILVSHLVLGYRLAWRRERAARSA